MLLAAPAAWEWKQTPMGKKAIKTIDLSQEEAKPASSQKEKKQSKKTEAEDKAKKEAKAKKELVKKAKARSKRYLALKTKVDKNKLYPLDKAVELLLKLANSKIDETVEIHLSTREQKLTGQVKLPHGTGKKQKIVIADNKILTQIAKGKINFDVLIATPKIMPQIAKVAKILGPKGLMPNPKAGTVTDKPQELKKKLEQGEARFKTEPKAPLIHMSIGKISFGKAKILANLEAFLKAVKVKNIKKAVLSATHSPGIKLDLTSLK